MIYLLVFHKFLFAFEPGILQLLCFFSDGLCFSFICVYPTSAFFLLLTRPRFISTPIVSMFSCLEMLFLTSYFSWCFISLHMCLISYLYIFLLNNNKFDKTYVILILIFAVKYYDTRLYVLYIRCSWVSIALFSSETSLNTRNTRNSTAYIICLFVVRL